MAKRRKGHRGPYTPEERKQAVEALLKSGLTHSEFARTWGLSQPTLSTWVRQHSIGGAQALERSSFREKPGKRGRKGIAPALKSQIIQTKLENPGFGIKSVRHFLMRFRGLKVSTGTISKTMKAEGIAPVVRRRRRRRSADKVRTFERARPMQLWQTDITSIVLPRTGTRCYLTVFLDDYSRYIVGWDVALRQTGEFVMGALLKGIERFGKPEEVLSDQGRQYFSWRGKSDFQKLLIKQGIRHVVARSHHPQTVGKCERLWKAIKDELLERTRPDGLEDLRERLTHFLNHYNHFRPHQGIDGMTPADRFFGLENDVRQALEASFAANELRLATGESPRAPVFLVGQIGDKPITMHGEAGRLVVQTPDGALKTLNYENFGHQIKKEDQGNETKRAEGAEEGQGISSIHGSIDEHPRAENEETSRNKDTNSSAASGENPLGERNTGAEGKSPPDGGSDPRDLDGPHQQAGGGAAAGNPPAQILATVAAGDFGYAGGVTGATQDTSQGSDHGSQRGPESLTQEDCRTRSNDQEAGSADSGASIDAGMQGCATTGDSSASHSGSKECNSHDQQSNDSNNNDGQGTPRSSR